MDMNLSQVRKSSGRSPFFYIALLIFVLFVPFVDSSSVEAFTAATISDYGNVTVMEVEGVYDARNPDDTLNTVPREKIAKEFLRTHKDEYDFLVIYTNFDFQMLYEDTEAFYLPVKNDTQGTGQEVFDNSAFYGSDGKLQGVIDMGNIANLSTSPLDPGFEDTLNILSHEVMHRWAAYTGFKEADDTVSTALIGRNDSHWNFLLDTDGSLLYGNDWQDNGDGTFTSISAGKYYSPLDLYLMGFYDKSQVPPMMLIENSGIDPARLPEAGIAITGTSRTITIDDIIAAEGERTPGVSASQKAFKAAFILITTPGTFTGYEIHGLGAIRNGWTTRFSILTDGRGIMQVALAPKEDLPFNPGVIPPSVDPRTLPPDIDEGVTWLMNNQQADGSWMDLPETVSRDTSGAVLVLKNYPVAQQNYSDGLQWLGTQSSDNMDYLSRKIETLVKSGQDVTPLVDELLSWQNTDGGWGSGKGYRSNALDTSFVLKALSAAGSAVQSVISNAIEYLKTKQNTDGGWGYDKESIIQATSNVLSVFNKYRSQYQLDDQINNGTAWLLSKQNPDGGFGNSPSTVYDSAVATLVLRELDASTSVTNDSLNYILDQQSENGSWYDSPYQTALAVSAVWTATIEPDLSVKAGDITFVPAAIETIPSTIVMNAEIWNLGRTDVSQAKVVLYKDSVSDENKISEQDLAFPGQSSVTVPFSVAISDSSEHRFYIVIDPDNAVSESNETNNTTLKVLYPQATYDFEMLDADVTVSVNPVDMLHDVTISSKVTNKGTMTAYNVQLNYFIDEAGVPFAIATDTVDVPAGATVDSSIIWKTNRDGNDMAVTVTADPFDSFAELLETNNTAVTLLTVNAMTDPNLTVSYQDITLTPDPANELGNVDISAIVKNDGFSDASGIEVNFYKGVPGDDGVLIGTETIQTLAAGDSSLVSVTWSNIMDSGEKIIYVQADPGNLVAEVREDDNDAFTTLNILNIPDLTLSANSIVFSPPAPKEGDIVAINVTVQNAGQQTAAGVDVRVYDNGNLIDTQTITSISGLSEEAASFSYDTTGGNGAHQITVEVDPDNTITERSEDNNSASRSFGVQDDNFWLTEPYISPNGDGIKDSTEVFFRLAQARTVKIVVADAKNTIVRTFSGAEFENTLSGTALWDGLNDSGVVVDDGQYQVQLSNLNNSSMGTLTVVVDNNRSLLSEAIGTEYLVQRNLTCELPDFAYYTSDDEWERLENDFKWLSNDSGAVVRIKSNNSNSPEYTKGFYTVAADGTGIVKISPEMEEQGYEYRPSAFVPSPDGGKIAFSLCKRNNSTNFCDKDELWVSNGDGTGLTLLASHDRTEWYEGIYIESIKWSPEGSHIIYVYRNYTRDYEVWTVKADGTGNNMVGSGGDIWEKAGWSTDSSRLAYINTYYDSNLGQQVSEIWVSDTAGNNFKAFTTGSVNWYLNNLVWTDEKSLFVISEDGIWLVDASGGGNHVKLSDETNFQSRFLMASPDQTKFAYISRRNVDGVYNYDIKVVDNSGKTETLYTTLDNPIDMNDPEWSPDSSKLVFVDSRYGKVDDCNFEPYMVVADLKSGEQRAFKVGDAENICGGGYSFHIDTLENGSWTERGVIHFGLSYSTQKLDLSDYFDNTGGTYHIKLSQTGADAAHMDNVTLSVDGRHYQPVQAVNVTSGEDIVQKIISRDNDVAGVHESTVEIVWEGVPDGKRIALFIHAREENLNRRKALPFRYPKDDYYSVSLDNSGPVAVDGEITNADNLAAPLFREFSRPVTGHPGGATYGYVKSDGQYLYGVLDFTADNTVDSGKDWASMDIITPAGTMTYLVNDSQQTYGQTSLTYTDKVNYQHKVYEFRIPLSELGLNIGEIAEIAFNAYGTAAQGGGNVYFEMSSLQWMSDNTSLIAMDTDGAFVLNLNKGEKIYLPVEADYPDLLESPLGKYIAYETEVEPGSICADVGYRDIWALSSLLNLSADLRAVKEKTAIILKGTAADLDFEGYMLEYADVNTPDQWNPVSPPFEIPVVNDVFTTWVPPYAGTFYVKLTVWDKAGNRKSDVKRISWGLTTSITNIYKNHEVFSPYGAGAINTVELHYEILDPVHLEFFIYDENDNLLKTITKDHVAPVEAYITWDGTDRYGRYMPDGTYRIEVFDYSFFVEIDNTPPDVFLELHNIKRGAPDDIFGEVYGADLYYLADDSNFKSRIFEYGEGDNPVDWLALNRGFYFGSDEEYSIIRFIESEIGWLGEKKLRLTVEDYAGNRSTYVSNMIEEKVIVYQWDEEPIDNDPVADVPGTHTVWTAESVRKEIESMVLQYREVKANSVWQEEEAVYPESFDVPLSWDNSHLDIESSYHVRVKAVDVLGSEYYSNEFIYGNGFHIAAPCGNIRATNAMEDLELLRIQIQSDEDPTYREWSDIALYEGSQVPYGAFERGVGVKILPNSDYGIRMIGLGVSGETYYHESSFSITAACFTKPFIATLNNPPEAPCNSLSSGEWTYSPIVSANALELIQAYDDLVYFLEDASETRTILASFDLSAERDFSALVHTADVPEGPYTFNAILIRDQEEKSMDTKNILVDRTLPVAQITYPADTLMLCPIMQGSAGNEWYGINIEGIVNDNNDVRSYKLYYGNEETDSWSTATTRNNGRVENIAGSGPLQGQIGIWDVTGLEGSVYSLKLEVVDSAGNKSCYITTVSIDTAIEIGVMTKDKSLFSPNGDDVLDDVSVTYEIHESASVDVRVFKLLKNSSGKYVLDSSSVRTIESNSQHSSGTAATVWDGMDDAGNAVPDGKYGITVFATDSCGNTVNKWIAVDVDTTAPDALISSPQATDTISNIVEVKGTADDVHFMEYQLEAGEGVAPSEWTLVSGKSVNVEASVLGTWNTYELNLGKWTLKLTAYDKAGNSSYTEVVVDLGPRMDLIKDLGAAPALFSPNSDGLLENTDINYELTYASDVTIEIFDSADVLQLTDSFMAQTAGTHTYAWDGAGSQDGEYNVKLTAALSSDTSITQVEAITVAVDKTLPLVDMQQPAADSYLKTDATIEGTVSDDNILEYTVTYTGDSGTEVIDTGGQSRVDYTFGILNGPPEGSYTLNITAKDLGENVTAMNIPFTIDRTAPEVTLNTPGDGEFYGSSRDVVDITASIVEENLDTFSLRYGPGATPAQWTELLSANTLPVDPQLYSWNVGSGDGVPDGLYTLSLYALDKAGFETEARIMITIDNTPPQVEITMPAAGGYVKQETDILGTASDQNFDNYKTEFSSGSCSNAFKWATIKTSSSPVQNGALAEWNMLPADGEHCLRLSAVDELGNTAETKVDVIIDTHPPGSSVLTGQVENKTDVRLSWMQNNEPDFAGYNLYRDGQKINAGLITDISYLDQGVSEGKYSYTVMAVDLAGWESDPSEKVEIIIDLTGPNAGIRFPVDASSVSSIVDIKGTAYSDDDFKQYRIYVGLGSQPVTWNLIRTSPVPISFGELARWDTSVLGNDVYSIKLETEDINGNINTSQVTVTIDNEPPAVPVLISVIPTGSDVDIQWQANTEADLAGYLLYRNNQLVNVSGIVIGDLSPYLISGTTYTEGSLPDGKFNYYLFAMDTAGNISNQSNAIEVEIDTHDPQADIVEPLNGAGFENTTLVKADSTDMDIASVQFQYKRTVDTIWTDLNSAVTVQPYVTYIDPLTLGLSYGDFDLRAVATDTGDKTDQTPSYITVTYSDFTAPAIPVDPAALTDGQDVTLSWTGNVEADIDGYNIYRTEDGTRTKINTNAVTNITFNDSGLMDGLYVYDITAVDTYGNESGSSASVSASIYAPEIEQPYTPIGQNTMQISGSNAEPDSTVEIFVNTGSGPISQGTTVSDGEGNFVYDLIFALGENGITAKATDSNGNTSRVSDEVVVVYDDPPSAPTGLVADVNGYDVDLAWNSNTESDLAGYNVYRNGEKLNDTVDVTSGTATASSTYYLYPIYNQQASYAFDSNPSTYWMSARNSGTMVPIWLEINLTSAELIRKVDVQWYNNSYVGKDYEIQVWSGHTWITLETLTGNEETENSFIFTTSYRTDRIRVYISAASNYYKQVGIAEINILSDDLVTGTSYNDINLGDGRYTYNVTAVDYYGFESLFSDDAQADVGDVTPPSAPQDLTATAAGSDIDLGWTANTEADLSGYNVYRDTADGWLKINASLVTNTTYIDQSLSNGTYTYRITAVDALGNESSPSTEASADVNITLPEPPANLGITPLPEGEALSTSWEYTAGPVAGYNLYRAADSGGPYTRINDGSINGLNYMDSGLVNGVTYYYVVTAEDSAGNESPYSNEAAGTPEDITPPAKPGIFLSGECRIEYTGMIDISGSSDPGVTIELYHDGEFIDQTVPLANDAMQSMEFDYAGDGVSLSSDGKTLAYSSDGSMWLMDMSTGSTTQFNQDVYDPVWSPDRQKIAYTFYNTAYWNSRIGIYDVHAGIGVPLTVDTGNNFDEYSPSWSSDGTKIAFRSDIGGSFDVWLKDLSAGTLIQVTSGINTYNPVISPDGQRIAYFTGSVLYVIETESGLTTEVDTDADNESAVWSSDSTGLAFVSDQDGTDDIYIYNVEQQGHRQITNSPEDKSKPAWSPDGNSIVYEQREADWSRTVVVVNTQTMDSRILYQNPYSLDYLDWSASGKMIFIQDETVFTAELQGQYTFSNVQMEPGENIFHVQAIDPSGNTRASDEVCVIYDTSLLPELEITVNDIFVYPTYPVDGDQAVIITTFRNNGQVAVENVDVDIYVWDSSGNLEPVHSETIAYMLPDSTQMISMIWDSSDMTGENTVIAIVDPDDRIQELTETNNLASKEILVVDEEGLMMTTTIDQNQYTSSENININVTIINSGIDSTVEAEVRIEDENGFAVDLVDTVEADLAYGSRRNYSFLWNTGSSYAGSYRVRTILRDSYDVIGENIVPFTLLPDARIGLTLSTDMTNYDIGEDVYIHFDTVNSGDNHVFTELSAVVRVTDSSGIEQFSDIRTINNLLPGVTVSLDSVWNTALSVPGDYSATVDIYDEDQLVSGGATSFGLDGSIKITGSIAVLPAVASLGDNITVEYTVNNIGSVDVEGLILNVLVVEPGTQTVIGTGQNTADLQIGDTYAAQAVFATAGYGLQMYTVKLQYIGPEGTRNVASTSFTVRDGTPPAVNILSPLSGSIFTSAVSMVAVVSDTSDIDRVEYMLDSSSWKLLPVSDPSQGRYSTMWIPDTLDDEGNHTVSFRAADIFGNTSATVTALFTVEFIPPVSDAGPDQNVITGEFVTLDGSGSYDPEGETIIFLWTFTDVPPASTVTDTSLSDVTSAKPTFTTDVDGEYILELTVYDGKLTDSQSVTVSASTPNVRPNAHAGPDQNVSTGSVAYLDGSGSNDPDNIPAPLSYSWSFSAVPAQSSLADMDIMNRDEEYAGFIPDADGVYLLELTVSDGELSSSDQVMITSLTPNVPPNANAGTDISVSLGDTVELDGSGTHDPDNGPAPLMFSWSFVAVPTGSSLVNSDISDADTVSPSYMPDVAGTYVLELMASDGLDTSFDNVAVTAIDIPVISLTPTSIDFGDVDLGQTSGAQTITVVNEASAELVINDVNISGSNSVEFIHTNNCSIIGAAESCTISVVFTPDGTGMKNALLNILSNDPNMPSVAVPLSGNGVDLTPPVVSATASKDMLWPPNHKMVDIIIAVDTADNSGLPVTLTADVRSNEPVTGQGSGNTSPDWTDPVINQDTGIINLQLRAERSGSGSGRIYTVTITADDISTNSSSIDIEIVVPHNNVN